MSDFRSEAEICNFFKLPCNTLGTTLCDQEECIFIEGINDASAIVF